MNTVEKNILLFLKNTVFINQRILSENIKCSLGKTNQSLQKLRQQRYLNGEMILTEKSLSLFETHRARRAIILAAGYGMRMIPINMESPKGLLQVDDEPLIERIIRQLQEVEIRDITIIVGFMKESYEYLIDKYSVKLLVNVEYASKNNLHSLALSADKIDNTYIIPCDIWCEENPFSRDELYSWYMVCERLNVESNVRVNRKQELIRIEQNGNQMIGIAYITYDVLKLFKENLLRMDQDFRYRHCFWEEALFYQGKMLASARVVKDNSVYEINTYEQLRELDSSSKQLYSHMIKLIAEILKAGTDEIKDIRALKKGMTNRSFLFTCRGIRYIMRIPGEGTERLINRRQEYEVYQTIKGLGISDDIFYIDPEKGYKMTAYLENARACDLEDIKDVQKCMRYLRKFHEMGLKVKHVFDIYEQIEFYETLWYGEPSCYCDYKETKRKVWQLKKYIDNQPKAWALTHIDAVPDNFLFVSNGKEEEIRLLDWEYAGMQDPHVDIAMFAIYAMYDREQVEDLIEAYFPEGCYYRIRIKIYCYIAACGLLWSNWCEYKRKLGVEFGEYSMWQYRYAKEYYQIVQYEFKKRRMGILMNRVERAIIMAAGTGKRMQPITFDTPKPLVRVKGARMIDTVIQGLRLNHIFEIYIVVGYQKEKFRCLEKQYPGVVLIENPYYDIYNNISSLYMARDYIKNAMILDGDQMIYNPSVLCTEFGRSGYNCVWTEKETGEWLLAVENGIVKNCSRIGGRQGWQLFSISRWSAEDGRRLKYHIEVEFEEKKNRQIYWDDVALFCYPEEYQLGIREMQYGDVVEIDNLQELMALDKSYSAFIKN